jgi:hypothetical protein
LRAAEHGGAIAMAQLSQDELELMSLVSAVWDERMTPELWKRVEELLALDEGDRVKLLSDFTRLHMGLEQVVSSSNAHIKAEKAIAKLKVERLRQSPNQVSHVKPLLTIAAWIILVLLGYWFSAVPRGNDQVALGGKDIPPMKRQQLPIGRMFSLTRARWAEGSDVQVGQTLVEGQVIDLVEGIGQLSLDFGAEMAVEGPCRLTLAGDGLVLLEYGTIMVKAAHWAKGFQVRTNDLSATDLGTQFVVTADPQDGSELHVLEGAVIARSLKLSTAEREVRDEGAVRVRRDGVLEFIKFHRENIANSLQQIAPLRRLGVNNTGVGVPIGAKDPHWLITAGDSQYAPFPRPATVCTPGAKYGENDPAHSQWISVYEGTTEGVPVRTRYTFTTNFNLNGIDPNTVRLTAILKADNGVVSIWLNGKRLPISPWQDWFPGATFYDFNKVEITSGFVPGNNILSIIVNNETQLSEEDGKVDDSDKPNPMALRVEWAGSGRVR